MNESSLSGTQAAGGPSVVTVDSVADLQECISQSTSVLVVGNRTKPALSQVDESTTLISTRGLVGITQYEPSEFTFTALAGTPLHQINGALREKRQYLPFDPMLVAEGATLGGTLAAGLSGPGRHRFGGLRDFVLGATLITGDGERIRSGGKVVKNAAGFDIPKCLVGSCGRYGAVTELTFKVFPKPVEFHSYSLSCDDHREAARCIAGLARGRWELDAVDYRCDTREVWIRLGGPKAVCDQIVDDIRKQLDAQDITSVPAERCSQFWSELNGLRFGAATDATVKLPMTLDHLPVWADWCDQQAGQVGFHLSVAGAIGWLMIAPQVVDDFQQKLLDTRLCGMLIRPPSVPSPLARPTSHLLGHYSTTELESRVKAAFDPPGRYPRFYS